MSIERRIEAIDDLMDHVCGPMAKGVPVRAYRRFYKIWDRAFANDDLPKEDLTFLDEFEAGLNRLAKGLPWKLKPVFKQLELQEINRKDGE